MRAVVIVVPDQLGEQVAALCHATLTVNGFAIDGPPAVIDWPPSPTELLETGAVIER